MPNGVTAPIPCYYIFLASAAHLKPLNGERSYFSLIGSAEQLDELPPPRPKNCPRRGESSESPCGRGQPDSMLGTWGNSPTVIAV